MMSLSRRLEHVVCRAAAGLYSACLCLILSGMSASAAGPGDIIPVPYGYEVSSGTFGLTGGKTFHVKGDSSCGRDAMVSLEEELLSWPFSLVKASGRDKADILVLVDAAEFRSEAVPAFSGNDEAYRMEVTPDGVKIYAGAPSGAFYALQSLLQMTGPHRDEAVSCCIVEDKPRFGYRGLHFDVSRHFRTKEFLMKQMDAMAMLKLNRMHLHLTDGAGWRMEISGLPRLTEFAAWRPYRKWTDWAADPRYCERTAPDAYGGYYTREDIKEMLDYAARKHIEVIPEIEMPGHSEEVLAAYPQLSCAGGTCGGGDLCPGKEATFDFLETVLSEVIDLFPSEYIHIGSDEASKSAWKTCPDCRRRMQEEGLHSVDELQDYLIHRIGEFVSSKGRRIIGWDEILHDGLSRDAVVMSWRGTEGGIRALKSGHDVIMTPNSCCYLDYTQDAPFKEPVSIGGYVPLSKVYSYEPAAEGFTEEELSHLLGVQGNLWSEYVTEDSHAEYMYFPRAYAIAETGWSRAESKDYGDFRRRVLAFSELMSGLGYSVFDLTSEYGERKESLANQEHLALDCNVSYASPINRQYPAAGEMSLVDGILGGWTYGDGKWQGFLSDIDVTIDLGEVRTVHYVGATFMQVASAWVYMPERVDVLVSEDGVDFRPAGSAWRDLSDRIDGLFFRTYGVVFNEPARYVRFVAERNSRPGTWLFTDEIIVN